MRKTVKKRGFTIVELVIVIAVIAILAAVLIPAFGNIIDKAKESAAMQEAMGAYTEYLIDHAVEADDAEYLFYKTESKVVVIKNGASFGVYETEEDALKAAFDDPETTEDESAGCTLGTLEIDGLYFMQSSEQTECAHSYDSVITPPTCVNGGYTTHTCSLCGDNYTDSETPATGEHNYTDGVCACGAEEPIVVVAQIGNSTKLFDLVATDIDGIYTAVISSNGTTSNSLFFYNTSQFITNDIPETKEYKGIKLHPAGGIEDGGTIIDTKANRDENINLKPGHDHILTLDFNTNTWSLEIIPNN